MTAWVLLAGWMLLFPETVLRGAETACALFAQSVMPPLYPYMILLLLIVDRMPENAPLGALMALGWGAGSPCGARICAAKQGMLSRRKLLCLAVSCGTMSPMFLLGTVGEWLGNRCAAACVLAAVLIGGALTGQLVLRFSRDAERTGAALPRAAHTSMTLGQAVEKASITLLTVCGCMVLGNVVSELLQAVFPTMPPALSIVCACLTEVTGATRKLCALPVPLVWRAALVSGETAFGAAAILMQNRACYPLGLMPLWQQILYQLLHGAISFALGLGLALMLL